MSLDSSASACHPSLLLSVNYYFVPALWHANSNQNSDLLSIFIICDVKDSGQTIIVQLVKTLFCGGVTDFRLLNQESPDQRD